MLEWKSPVGNQTPVFISNMNISEYYDDIVDVINDTIKTITL